MASNVQVYRDEGYTRFQLKVGGDPDTDIDRIKAGQFYLTRRESSSTFDAAQILGEEVEVVSGRERAIFIEKISSDQALEKVFIRTRTGSELQVISSRSGLLVKSPVSDYDTLELENARIFKQVMVLNDKI